MADDLTAPVEDPVALLKMLSQKLKNQRKMLDLTDQYYSGTQPLQFLAPEVIAQVGDRLASVAINWPRIIVDSVRRRTFVQGFRLGGGGEPDAELWRWWQANDLDEWSDLGRIDALVHGRSYMSVWSNPDDDKTPKYVVESPHEVVVCRRPGTKTLRAALKRWRDDEFQYATLYLPDQILKYRSTSRYDDMVHGKWELYTAAIDNPLGAVPIVPVVNRPRVLNLDGESELTDVMPIADAINKLATDMLVASEFSAMPRRWATGIQLPGSGTDPEARARLEEEVKRYWDNATKNKTWLAGQGVNFGQFTEASLDNFGAAIKLLTAHLAAIGGVSPDDLGLNTVNPASAEARRAADTTLILRAEEKTRSWSGSYETMNRMGVAVVQGVPLAEVPEQYKQMETVWSDPNTPTLAQTADAAVKLHDDEIIDTVYAQEMVGISPMQRAAMAARRNEAAASAATADVEAKMTLARQLMQTDGLTQNAALAAVGLFVAASENKPTP